MLTEMQQYITELELDEYREVLLAMANPSIELITSEFAITLGCSKFGGSPDLPTDFKWPHHQFGLYRFIGQLNLTELPANSSELPRQGLLSFFYAHDENGNAFWQDPDY